MIFNGVHNQSVELKITNYQFPHINDGGWDGNWLKIYLGVKSDDGQWQTTHPSLTTWEFQQLILWFEDLSKNLLPDYTDMSFTEPNLSFELLNYHDAEYKMIRIKFDHECRPESAIEGKNYFVDFQADNNELLRISIDLKSELDKFPERRMSPGKTSSNADLKWWQKLFKFN